MCGPACPRLDHLFGPVTDFPPEPPNSYRRPDHESWPGDPRSAARKGGRKPLIPGRRRWPRRALIGINAIVALCLIGTASAYGYVQWRLDQIHREKLNNLAGSGGGKPFNLLIVGSDTRSALANNADNKQFGGGSATPGQRSDTIIVARVAPAAHQIELMSIPRDLWVDIPGQGMNRINAAFDTGANLLVKTIETDLGIPINHFVEVDFDTFRAVTDAVGGVSFYFPTPARDAYSLLNVPQPGCVKLTGDQALGFVRSRHYQYYLDGSWHFQAESDLARVQRQQAFIKKMIKKAEGEYTNPIAINNVVAGLTKNLTLDSGFSNSLILSLAQEFRSINASGIPSLTLPNYPFTTPGGADVLGLQQPQAAQTIASFNSFGNAAPAPAASGSTTTTQPSGPSVAPSSVSVEVANGTGVAGQAAALAAQLTRSGYRTTVNPVEMGRGLAGTEIRYAPDSAAAARQLAARIPGGATLVESAALTPTRYNVEVVTGDSYTSGHAPAASPTSATTAAAPTTTPSTVPGSNPDTYVLPGTPSGQTPPSCS